MDLYPLLPMAAGLVILAVVYRQFRFTLHLNRSGVRAKARVIGYEETNTASRMIVHFRTEDGREVHAAHESTGWTASRSGEIVTVSYDPARPERARIVAAPWLSNYVRDMFTALGLLLVLIGAFLGYLRWG